MKDSILNVPEGLVLIFSVYLLYFVSLLFIVVCNFFYAAFSLGKEIIDLNKTDLVKYGLNINKTYTPSYETTPGDRFLNFF